MAEPTAPDLAEHPLGPLARVRACQGRKPGEVCEVGGAEQICVSEGGTPTCSHATSMDIDVARLHDSRLSARDVGVGLGAIGLLATTACACAGYSSSRRLRWARRPPIVIAAWVAFAGALALGLGSTLAATSAPAGPARVVYRVPHVSDATNCQVSSTDLVQYFAEAVEPVDLLASDANADGTIYGELRLGWRRSVVIAMDPDTLGVRWHLGPCNVALELSEDRVLARSYRGFAVLTHSGAELGSWRYRDEDAFSWFVDKDRIAIQTAENRSVMVLIEQSAVVDPAPRPLGTPERSSRRFGASEATVQGVSLTLENATRTLNATHDGKQIWFRSAVGALIVGTRVYLSTTVDGSKFRRIDPRTGSTLAELSRDVLERESASKGAKLPQGSTSQ